MGHHPPTKNVDTIALIREVVADFMKEGRIFFALEVSNEVKRRGAKMTPPKGLGHHREMAPVIERMMSDGAMQGYAAKLVPVAGGTRHAYLYHPIATPAAELEKHHNRTVTALPPVGTATGTTRRAQTTRKASGSTAFPTTTAAKPKKSGAAGKRAAGIVSQSDRLGILGGHILGG